MVYLVSSILVEIDLKGCFLHAFTNVKDIYSKYEKQQIESRRNKYFTSSQTKEKETVDISDK